MITNINKNEESFVFNNTKYYFGDFEHLIEEEFIKGNIKFAKYLFNNISKLYDIRNSFYGDPLGMDSLSAILNNIMSEYGDIRIIKLLLDEGVPFNEIGAYRLGNYIKTYELFNIILNSKSNLFNYNKNEENNKEDREIFISNLIYSNLFKNDDIEKMAKKINVDFYNIYKGIIEEEKIERKETEDRLSLLKDNKIIDFNIINNIYLSLYNTNTDIEKIIIEWNNFISSILFELERDYKINEDELLYNNNGNIIVNKYILQDKKNDLLLDLQINYNDVLDEIINNYKNI